MTKSLRIFMIYTIEFVTNLIQYILLNSSETACVEYSQKGTTAAIKRNITSEMRYNTYSLQTNYNNIHSCVCLYSIECLSRVRP